MTQTSPQDPTRMRDRAELPDLAVIGGGPRATYLLQNLLHRLDRGAAAWFGGVVVYNAAGPFGSGWVHDARLPEYAMLNRSADGLALGPGEPPIDLLAWIEDSTQLPTQPLTQPLTQPPTQPWTIRDHSWVSRAAHGAALTAIFDRTCQDLRSRHGIRVELRHALVTDLEQPDGPADPDGPDPGVDASRYLVRTDDGEVRGFAATVVVVGHEFGHRALVAEDAVRTPYPWPSVPAQARVEIEGTGLSGVELVLHLCEGAGGRFVSDTTGAPDHGPAGGSGYRYLPSGREPARITMVSPSGLLPLPRPWDADRVMPDYQPRRLRLADAGEITADSLGQMVLDELEHAFTVFGGTGPLADDPLIAAYVLRSGESASTVDLVARGISQSSAGMAADPVCAALETVFRRLRPVIQAICDRRALPPAEDQEIRRGLFAVISKCVNGPSLESMRRMHALLLDGRLRIEREDSAVPDPGAVRLAGRIRTPEENDVPADGLTAGPPNGAPTLITRLTSTGMVTTGPSSGYSGVMVDDRFQALAGDGRPRRGLFVLGAPLEGFKSFQFSAARPTSGHEVLADIDVVSRHLLQSNPTSAPVPDAPSTPQTAPQE